MEIVPSIDLSAVVDIFKRAPVPAGVDPVGAPKPESPGRAPETGPSGGGSPPVPPGHTDPNAPHIGAGDNGGFVPPPAHGEDQVLTWNEYTANGNKAIARQDGAIRYNPEDLSKPSWKTKYQEDPAKTVDVTEAGPAGLFKAIGLSPKAEYTRLTEFTDKNNKPVHQCSYNKDQKSIIADSNFRKKDNNPPEEQLLWSELTFQRWKEIAGDDVAQLKFVIRQHIVNKGSVNTLEEAYNKLGIPPNKKAEFYPSSDNPAMDNAFRTLAGTDNAKGVFYMMADHHRELQNLKVVKIHTWFQSWESWPAIVLELGH